MVDLTRPLATSAIVAALACGGPPPQRDTATCDTPPYETEIGYNCGPECRAGDVVCALGAIQRCRKPEDTWCTYWTEPEPCPGAAPCATEDACADPSP